ncbi:hypothetical protein [Burkholderia ubonensis]|uniref:hypothetical protein n=1 Tax=Burkholderia ubonensis TaxID=101571 RepID=UPI000A4D02B1|nr:hypothetical protein [Burkholderia ubonensis]
MADLTKASPFIGLASASGMVFRTIVSILSTIDSTGAMAQHNFRCHALRPRLDYASGQ